MGAYEHVAEVMRPSPTGTRVLQITRLYGGTTPRKTEQLMKDKTSWRLRSGKD